MYLLSDFERAHDELLAPYWSLDWLRNNWPSARYGLEL
jgi:hypothetical protein